MAHRAPAFCILAGLVILVALAATSATTALSVDEILARASRSHDNNVLQSPPYELSMTVQAPDSPPIQAIAAFAPAALQSVR